MKTIKFALLSTLLLTSAHAFAECPFTDTFHISAPWAFQTMKVLSVKEQKGDSTIRAGQTYNPKWTSGFLYNSTFEIVQNQCNANLTADTSRDIEVKVGYDESNYCIINITDGPLMTAKVTNKTCKGFTTGIGSVDYGSLTYTGESISQGKDLRDYYVNLTRVLNIQDWSDPVTYY